jgi:hypothetical protein
MPVTRAKEPKRKKGIKKVARKPAAGSDASVVEAYGNTWQGIENAKAQDIKAVEQQLALVFPASLVEFLLNCSGGRPAKNFFDDAKSEVFELGIGYVLPIRDRPRQRGLAGTCLVCRTAQSLDPNLIPFAFDIGNANLICLRLPRQDIVYWVHDELAQPVRRVAESLERFLRGLGQCPF